MYNYAGAARGVARPINKFSVREGVQLPRKVDHWWKKMEKAARNVPRKEMPSITGSNVDPAELSEKLLAAGIIGPNQMQQAAHQGTPAPQRLRDLVVNMMGNGKPGVFETFVTILLDEEEWN